MNDLIEFILLEYFGEIFLGLCLLIAALLLRNKISQLISVIPKLLSGSSTLPSRNPHAKSTLRVNDPLRVDEEAEIPSDDVLKERFNDAGARFPGIAATTQGEVPPPKVRKKSVGELVIEAARGKKR